MSQYKQSLGKRGEEIAEEYLLEKNYKIMEKNIRFGKLGEIDLIAEENGDIVFVEVKTRSSKEFGTPLEAINLRKQGKMIKLALTYLKKKRLEYKNCRFDIVGIILDKNKEIQDISLIKNAFLVK